MTRYLLGLLLVLTISLVACNPDTTGDGIDGLDGTTTTPDNSMLDTPATPPVDTTPPAVPPADTTPGGGAGDALNNAGDAAGDALNDAGQAAGDALDNAGQAAGDALNDAGQAAGDAAQGAAESLDNAGEPLEPLTPDLEPLPGNSTAPTAP
jgi:hypothetical protein